jgi:hypothetical protein
VYVSPPSAHLKKKIQCKPEEYTAQLAAAIKKNKYLKELRLEGCGLGKQSRALHFSSTLAQEIFLKG